MLHLRLLQGQTVVLGKSHSDSQQRIPLDPPSFRRGRTSAWCHALTTTFRRKGGAKRTRADARHRGDALSRTKAIPLNPPSQAKGEESSTPFGTKGVARSAGGCRGFTLVELMITLAIGAILLMIAVPSFQHLILSNRLTTSANALADALNTARMDAIKLNADTQFCGSTATANTGDPLGAACGTAAGAVYSLPQSAATAGEVRATPPGIASPIQLTSAGMAAVRFSGRGFGYDPTVGSGTPYQGNVAVVCTSGLSSNNQRIVSMTTGSIVAVATSTGSCP
ncbi:MAG: prepilin-type N-terminal cleavage/methylation domain-containing protein [Rhodanobacteraceae bacterium]|nr:MAG: prepilin-type N-terminal cleavage/methylation domain-containing protein [Rhodanobacteraceae bacterium]